MIKPTSMNYTQLNQCGWLADASFAVGAVGMLLAAIGGTAVGVRISEDLTVSPWLSIAGGIIAFSAILFAAYSFLHNKVIKEFTFRITAAELGVSVSDLKARHRQ